MPTFLAPVEGFAGATDVILGVGTTGDAVYRWRALGNGKLEWSNGTATPDANLYRSAAAELTTDGTSRAALGLRAASSQLTALLGTEIVTNGTFTGSATGWTLGAGWSYSSNTALHTPGNTATMTQAFSGLTSGAYYYLTFTITGRTAGSVVFDLGGSTSTLATAAVTATGTFTAVLTSTTPTLTITPTTDFDGAIDTVSLKAISVSTPQAYLDLTLGVVGAELRAPVNTSLGVGQDALAQLITGSSLVAVGRRALRRNTTGSTDTAVGTSALGANTSGSNNTAIGAFALQVNTTGGTNTAVGSNALIANTTGEANAALGSSALSSCTTGGSNAAIGVGAGAAITTGSGNMAMGVNSLASVTTGSFNTAIGNGTLFFTTSGGNVGIGELVLADMTTGLNTGVGDRAGYTPAGNHANSTTTGTRQTLIGCQTGQGSATQRNDITAVGHSALCDGNYATALGSGASAGAAGAVAIGADNAGTSASTTVANEIKLGTSLHTVTVAGAEKVAAGGSASFATVGGALFDHFVDAGNTTTSETDLYSDSIPASTLSVNGHKIEAKYGGTFVNSTSTKQLRVYFGGTQVFDSGALTISGSSDWSVELLVIRVSSSVVRVTVRANTSGASTGSYAKTTEVTGLTLTNAQILKITGTAAGVGAATNDVVAKIGALEYRPAA